jgi:hypothetical protein
MKFAPVIVTVTIEPCDRLEVDVEVTAVAGGTRSRA